MRLSTNTLVSMFCHSLILFNLVSITGLYLYTIDLVSIVSVSPPTHTSAHDQLLAFFNSLFETILTFLIFLSPVYTLFNNNY